MLRVSALYNETEVDLRAVNGDAKGAAVGVEFGPELMLFAESLASRDEDLERRRQALLNAAGPAVLVDAAGVAANFQRMVRIADAIGIPVDDRSGEMGRHVRAELDLERFPSAANSVSV
ncbi:MAG: hypothetical protein F4X36_21660 [Gammaproteobacteria bacterium]|nr:hypothetical protein [Gammaproteobacteria bacterium]